MQELVIVRGLPSSTLLEFGRSLAEPSGADFHSVYDYFREHSLRMDFSKFGYVHDLTYAKCMHSLVMGNSAVVANVFSTTREIDRYVRGVQRIGKKSSCRVHVVKVTTENPNHTVPYSTIRSIYNRWEDYPGERTKD